MSGDLSRDRESRRRSILKAATWRVLATSTTMIIAYLITGKTSLAVSIAGVEVGAKIVIFYFHERAWQQVPRGTIRRLTGGRAPGK